MGWLSGCIAQSDVNNMYMEHEHRDIVRCVDYAMAHWLSSGGANVLNISKAGRCGVSVGKSKDSSVAVSMPLTVVRQIILYELQHSYLRVGSARLCSITDY